MNRKVILCVLLLCAAVNTTSSSAQSGDFHAFWQEFKTAVIKGDKDTVAKLSRFPIGMSYGIPSVRTRAQLLRRFREVFNAQTNAAKCFAAKEPEKDPAKAKDFSIACPDQAGAEVVVYSFSRTKAGWRFMGLDNLNE